MRRTLFPVSVAAILLASCSPAAYKVNPPPVAVEESSPMTSPEGTSSTTWRDDLSESVVEEEPEIVKEIPESQKDGYMRIVADLRWDQLTSKQEWKARFPNCLNDYESNYLDNDFIYPNPDFDIYYTVNSTNRRFVRREQKCSDFFPGLIPVNISFVSFSPNSGTESKTMTSSVSLEFFDNSQSRAFKAALSQKYNYTSDGYCSTYTCWDLGNVDASGKIYASPTPYTVSLLDQVQLKASDL